MTTRCLCVCGPARRWAPSAASHLLAVTGRRRLQSALGGVWRGGVCERRVSQVGTYTHTTTQGHRRSPPGVPAGSIPRATAPAADTGEFLKGRARRAGRLTRALTRPFRLAASGGTLPAPDSAVSQGRHTDPAQVRGVRGRPRRQDGVPCRVPVSGLGR